MPPTIPPHPFPRGEGKKGVEGDHAAMKLGKEIVREKRESRSDSECDIFRKNGDELCRKVRSDDEVVRRRRRMDLSNGEEEEDKSEDLTVSDGVDDYGSEDNSRNERSEEDPLYCIKVNEGQGKNVLLRYFCYYRTSISEADQTIIFILHSLVAVTFTL